MSTTCTARSLRRALTALLGALLLLGVPVGISGQAQAAPGSVEVLADTDNNSSTPAVREFAGATRYETSLATAQRYINTARASGNSASTVIVASGESLIDAAAAAGLARATNAPVLLTPTSTVFEPAAHLIEREGISRVIIVGGPSAVSPQVEATFNGVPGVQTVERIGGANRFHTAALIATSIGSTADYCDSGRRSALLVVGDSDSLADVTTAGPIAYASGIPILLTSATGLPAETVAAIRQLEITQLVLLGETVPADQLLSQLSDQDVAEPAIEPVITPIAGTNSFATSVAALQALQDCLGSAFDPQSVALISATALPDGISAAPMLGQGLRQTGQVTPVLLVNSDSLPAEVENYLRSTPSAVQITAIGGLNAVNAHVTAAAVASANQEPIPSPPGTSFVSGDPQECRLSGLNSPRSSPFGFFADGVTAGFPLPSWSGPSTGVLKVAALFVDFPDAAATYSTQEEDGTDLAEFERYLERASYGKLDVQVDPLHMWLRASRSWRTYLANSAADTANITPRLIGPEAIELALPFFDFSPGYDIVLVIHPSNLFGGGTANNVRGIAADGQTLELYSVVNSSRHDQTLSGQQPWWQTAAHEVGHNLGLPDLYPYNVSLFDTPTSSRPGRSWTTLEFGLMQLRGHMSVSQSDLRFHWERDLPPGWRAVGSPVDPLLSPLEMLAWSRWQLSWLDTERVVCLTEPTLDVIGTLNLVSDSSGVSMVMIPTSETNGLVIEARRIVGYDADVAERLPCCQGGVERRQSPNLIQEGLLIYEVNSRVRSGELPLRFWYGNPSRNLVLREYPILQTGRATTGVLADGSRLRVSVEADDGTGFSVRVTRD